jgi:hypothetical protein
LSHYPEVRAHALHFPFELPFEFGQGGHRAEIYASRSKAMVAELTRWYPAYRNRKRAEKRPREANKNQTVRVA